MVKEVIMFKKVIDKMLSRPGSDLPWLCIVNKKGPPYLCSLLTGILFYAPPQVLA